MTWARSQHEQGPDSNPAGPGLAALRTTGFWWLPQTAASGSITWWSLPAAAHSVKQEAQGRDPGALSA